MKITISLAERGVDGTTFYIPAHENSPSPPLPVWVRGPEGEGEPPLPSWERGLGARVFKGARANPMQDIKLSLLEAADRIRHVLVRL